MRKLDLSLVQDCRSHLEIDGFICSVVASLSSSGNALERDQEAGAKDLHSPGNPSGRQGFALLSQWNVIGFPRF
jgi:hypothetical protein